jgi:meckelin
MVNEWSELQTMRRISIPVNLILLLVIMEGANYKYVATPRPTASDLSQGDLNPALQFAHDIFWWLILSLGQYLWKWGIYERFVEPDPMMRYIDLCTVAKVRYISS